jgi:hypothetical protein
MQFRQYGKLLPDPKTTFKPRELIEGIVLRRLNFLLGFLAEGQTYIFVTYLDRLTDRLAALTADVPLSEFPFSIEEYPHLQVQPGLVNLHWRFCLMALGLTADQVSPNEELEVSSRSYHRAFLLPRYYYLEILAKLLGKPVATELFKYYLDQYLLSVEAYIPKVHDLDALRSREFGGEPGDPNNGWLVTVSNVEDGKLVFRNDNCLWVEDLDEIDDPEFLYMVCCYSDFQVARLQNENFELTRPLTIAMGDPICDKVFHDKRIVEQVVHPSQEFWDQIDVEVP